jgi:uncharacterized protein (TIGR03435 family)
MRTVRYLCGALLAGTALSAAPRAQTANPSEFDVVSIKRNVSGPGSGMSIRTLPDRTTVMVNGTMLSLVGNASPVPGMLLNNIVGLPDWVGREQYDVTARPPAGATPEQIREMWQTVFKTRMNFAAHVEQREAKLFSLVVARNDGRLGPELKKSALECGGPPTGEPPPPPSQNPADVLQRCGMMGGPGTIMSGGMTMEMLARNLSGRAGGPVADKTGLAGYYAVTLKFSPPHAADAPISVGDPPEFFVALEEQLGLKLQSEKGTVPYLIVEHMDRPTEN